MQRLSLLDTVTLVLGLYLAYCSPAKGAEGFSQRRQMFLDAVWRDYQANAAKPSAKQAFWRAEALFELGKIEEGRRLVHRGLDQLVPGNREMASGTPRIAQIEANECRSTWKPFSLDHLLLLKTLVKWW